MDAPVNGTGGRPPPRVLLINGVGTATRRLADAAWAAWRARTLSADAPDRLVNGDGDRLNDPSRPRLRGHVLVQVASTLAYTYPTLVAAEVTITDPAELTMVTSGLAERGVEVAHVVAAMTEEDLHASIHRAGGDPDTLRRALQHARKASIEVEALAAVAKVDVTGRSRNELVNALARVLRRRSWLNAGGSWTATHAASHPVAGG